MEPQSTSGRWMGAVLSALQAGCASHALVSTPPIAPPADATFIETADSVRLYTSIEGNGQRGVVWFVLGPEIASAPPYPKLTAALHRAGYVTALVHPRGTGYSDGPRGDIDDYSLYLGDYRRFEGELRARFAKRPIFLFGHSAGAAFALDIAARDSGPFAGVVLVNPAYKLVYAEGMGPTFGDYIGFAANYLFRPSALTVDMNGRPEAVSDADDRREALAMQRDPLVVRYFSLRYLSAQRGVMSACVENARKTTSPVLLIDGERDALVDPAGSTEIFDAVSAADKERLSSPGGHGSAAVEKVVEAIVRWLDERAEPSEPSALGEES